MQLVHNQPAAGSRSCRAFSLVELLVVIAIISILLVAAFPIFTNNSNSARQASREIIKGYLQQARAHAIASGNATALAIPVLGSDPALGARSASLVEVEVDNSSGSYEPIQENGQDRLLQRWGKLSGNFYFLTAAQANAPKPTVLETTNTLQVTSKGKTFSCNAIVFAPNGQIVQPPSGIIIAIAMGQAINRNGSLTLTDRKNGQPVFDLLQVNRLTGRTRFYKP
jgi:prepilin-type N-terminal cleavage/methylation domain-containing protein